MSGSRRRNRRRERLVGLTIDLARSVQNALDESPASGSARARQDAWWAAIQAATGTGGGRDESRALYAQAFAVAAAVTLAGAGTLLQPRVRDWTLAAADPLCCDLLNDVFFLLSGDGQPVEPALAQYRSVRQGLDRLRETLADPGEPAASPSGDASDGPLPFDFFEHFLAAHDAGHRRVRGVFYTPQPIARFIVAQLDRQIREEFGIPGGLADPITWSEFAARHPGAVIPREALPEQPFLSVLDPAVGTGVFLDEVIDLIHRRFRNGEMQDSSFMSSAGENTLKWELQRAQSAGDGTLKRKLQRGPSATASSVPSAAGWDDYVQRHLLPRLFGLEIMLPACVVAHLRLADRLARTGFSFDRPARIEVHLADTLAGPATDRNALFPPPSDRYSQAGDYGRRVAIDQCCTVVLGNPPFSGISQAEGRWISDLLQGAERRTGPVANYFAVAGQPLGERKHWLQDDYVKFLRFAHWKIEQAGCGLIGLITNHGYLDNPTFRGVRYQLLQTFPRIDVIDLHGNRKKKEICPDGSKDENVFGIDQGTAIGLFRRVPREGTQLRRHREFWGRSESKLDALEREADRLLGVAASEPNAVTVGTEPSGDLSAPPPCFFFVPRDDSLAVEYRRARSLVDIFSISVTAPVTARDHFVVAFERHELIERLSEFRDLSIPDDTIRRRFTNSRSRKHAPGDTRGWSLEEARRRLAADDRWTDKIRTCWYRPFDRRYVYWSGEMIDWPRDEVMRHMLTGPNLALIARRQMLPSQPCNYFWIADDLILDGLIRSDNRGSESVFPLYLYEPDDAETGTGSGSRTPGARSMFGDFTSGQTNLDPRFLEHLADALGLRPISDAAGDLQRTFGVEDALYYVYALFHSSGYRTRYADLLRADFPRVLLPRRTALFAQLCRCGRQLADAHLLRSPSDAASLTEDLAGEDAWIVAPGYPKYMEDQVRVNPSAVVAELPPRIWEFHVGGHQVCRKWLKDRRGRTLRPAERLIYRRMAAGIQETLDAAKNIDEAIAIHGGWSDAFHEASALDHRTS
ncbi:MAG: hypothetical protein KJ000_15020 [Pirellulaceae bacterium]|nr:hypothetical protein [Pirellulaceae bacterium]